MVPPPEMGIADFGALLYHGSCLCSRAEMSGVNGSGVIHILSITHHAFREGRGPLSATYTLHVKVGRRWGPGSHLGGGGQVKGTDIRYNLTQP